MAPRTTTKKREQFLLTLAETGCVKHAATAAGLDKSALYRFRKRNPDFAQAWEEALEIGAGALEDEAHRRAAEGVEEPVYYKGEVVGTVRRYSDVLLIFLLKGLKPERYNRAAVGAPPEGGRPAELAAEIVATVAAMKALEDGEAVAS